MSIDKTPSIGLQKASGLFRRQIFIPLAALIVLILFNLIADPSFFEIRELAILAIGMTLVTAASGGQDISVGAAIAISGSVVLRVLCGDNPRPDEMQASILTAFLISCVVSMLFGAFNGTLVAYFNIQPMIATLILYTAGRSIAAWINNNRLPIISDPSFGYFGTFIPGIPIPTPIFIAIICMAIIALVLKFTTLGLYAQSVGINPNSAKLNGINPAFIKFITYVIMGLCVAVAGFIKVTRFSTINYSVVALDIEMDAILAVALGGNALSGGKFSMASNVSSSALPAYKAVVVIVLVVLSAPTVRETLKKAWNRLRAGSPARKEA